MFQYDDIVRFIFKSINLIILATLSVYIFRKKILPLILQVIAKKKAYKHNLKIQYATLKKDNSKIDSEIVLQKENAEEISKKIVMWKKSFNKKCSFLEQDTCKIFTKIENRTQIQQNFLDQKSVKDIVIPIALEEAKLDLENYFSSEKQQNVFLNSSVLFLKRATNE